MMSFLMDHLFASAIYSSLGHKKICLHYSFSTINNVTFSIQFCYTYIINTNMNIDIIKRPPNLKT